MADDFEKAILFSFDQSGRVDPAVKAQAEAYLAQARASPEAWQLCLARFESSAYAEVRFWCAQTLGALARHSHAALPPAGRAALRAALVAHGTQAAGGPPLPGFLKNKVGCSAHLHALQGLLGGEACFAAAHSRSGRFSSAAALQLPTLHTLLGSHHRLRPAPGRGRSAAAPACRAAPFIACSCCFRCCCRWPRQS